MTILVTIGGSLSTNLLRRANEQNIVSDMLLIQTQVKIIMERVAFNGDISNYIGIKLVNTSNKQEIAGEALKQDELEKDTIYIYNKEILNNLGLNKINSGSLFLVDYSNGDIILPQGWKREDGTILYRLSQVNKNLVSYENTGIQVVTFESGTNYIEAEVFRNNSEENIAEYQFLISTTEESVKTKVGTWIQTSKYRFTDLLSNANYFIMIKTKTSSGEEQISKVYRVKTK